MPDRLTLYELELMDVLWDLGEGTVRDVCGALPKELAYTTVMTSLNILHARKGVLSRTKTGRAFTYKPEVTREQMAMRVFQELQPMLFGKTAPSLMLHLLSELKLEDEDIEAIKSAVAKAEEKRFT